MKRIGIDARLMYQTGVGVYIRNLLFHLQQQSLDGLEIYVYAKVADTERLLQTDPTLKNDHHFIWRSCEIGWHGFGEQTFFLWQLLRDRLDLVHFTYFSWPVLYPGRFVAIVHDITPVRHTTGKLSIRHPLWYKIKHLVFRWVFGQQVRRAAVIMTPTATVKSDVVECFGVDPERVRVVPEGLSFEMPAARSDSPLPYQYLLYVGNFYPHKNVEALVAAFSQIDMAHEVRLVLVGPANFFSQALHLPAGVRLVTDVSAQELADLYAHAVALVFPSLAEGFGLPLIEAMSFGTPLLVSDIKVFHEIAGSQALYFDPRDVASIQRTLASVLRNLHVAPLRRTVYDERVYSFAAMTERVVELYRES